MELGWKRIAITSVAMAVVLAALLIPPRMELRSPWMAELMDFAHLPVFAALAATLWAVLGRRWDWASAAAIALAGAGEVLQTLVGRSASWSDFVTGCLGAAVGVAAAMLTAGAASWWRAVGLVLLILACSVGPVLRVTSVVVDLWTARQAFPVLVGKETPWTASLWSHEDAWYASKPMPGEPTTVTFGARDSGASALVLFPVVKNWSGYERLCVEFAFDGEPLTLLLSVRDGQRVEPPARRFDFVREFDAGEHRVCFDLEELAAGGEFAPLDLTRVQTLHVGVVESATVRSVTLKRVALE